MDAYEHCCVCDCLTGKAGLGDDSLYTDDGKGPFCNDCYLSELYDALERRQILRQPLSREAQDACKPFPPEQLVDALQDRIHRDIGHGRAANTVSHKRLSDAVRIECLEHLLTDQSLQIEALEAEVEKAYREGWWDSHNHQNPDVGAAFGVPTNDDLGWIKYRAKMKEEGR